MKIKPILAHLDGLGFVSSGGALEFAGLRKVPGRLPALYVVPESDSAAPNRYGAGAVDQKVTAAFSVVIILSAVVRAGAAEISDEFEDKRAAVIQRLLGWTHPDCSGPVDYQGGRLLSADGTAFTWALRFSASYHIRKV